MRKYKLYLVLLFLGCKTPIFSQIHDIVKETKFQNQDGELYKRLNDFGHTHQTERKHLDSACILGCSFIRFKINERSIVSNVAFSAGTPPEIVAYMSKAIEWTNGYWTVKTINSKPVESQYMLLPVMYMLGIDCNRNESMYNNFWRMLWFDGNEEYRDITKHSKSNETLDCILLHPYNLGSGVH